MSEAIVLFARAPEGETKRLGLAFSAENALHRALLQHTLRVIQRTPKEMPLIVAHLGALDELAIRRMFADRSVTFVQQRGDTFEQRLLSALEPLEHQRLIVVGSDTPSIGAEDLLAARAGGLVIGPAPDGGAYLIAIDKTDLALLRGLPWCRSSLRRVLITKARAAGLALRLLQDRRDVDRAIDLRAEDRLLRSLGALETPSAGAGDESPQKPRKLWAASPARSRAPPPLL